jgi:hypothetical protein
MVLVCLCWQAWEGEAGRFIGYAQHNSARLCTLCELHVTLGTPAPRSAWLSSSEGPAAETTTTRRRVAEKMIHKTLTQAHTDPEAAPAPPSCARPAARRRPAARTRRQLHKMGERSRVCVSCAPTSTRRRARRRRRRRRDNATPLRRQSASRGSVPATVFPPAPVSPRSSTPPSAAFCMMCG